MSLSFFLAREPGVDRRPELSIAIEPTSTCSNHFNSFTVFECLCGRLVCFAKCYTPLMLPLTTSPLPNFANTLA